MFVSSPRPPPPSPHLQPLPALASRQLMSIITQRSYVKLKYVLTPLTRVGVTCVTAYRDCLADPPAYLQPTKKLYIYMGIGLCHHVEDTVDRSERGSCGGRVHETAFFVVLFVAEECWEEAVSYTHLTLPTRR